MSVKDKPEKCEGCKAAGQFRHIGVWYCFHASQFLGKAGPLVSCFEAAKTCEKGEGA